MNEQSSARLYTNQNRPPFVSILIPTKNVAPYIDAVLQSILNQEYPQNSYDIFILDGYSTDGTRDIVRKYPVTLIEGHENVPTFYNRVLDNLKGELIAFGDGDAIVDNKWLSKLVPHFTDPTVAGAGGLCLTANADHIVPRVIGYELKARYERMPSSISRIATMNVIYRKQILKQIGGFDEILDTGYDTDIGHRICNAGYHIVFDRDALVYHYNRTSVVAYFRQQYIYGKNVAGMYLRNSRIAAGDEITSLWMNIQPFVYMIIALFSVAALLFPIFGILALTLIAILFTEYLISAIRLCLRERDVSALFFVVLCFTRGVGWTLGGASYVFSRITYRICKKPEQK